MLENSPFDDILDLTPATEIELKAQPLLTKGRFASLLHGCVADHSRFHQARAVLHRELAIRYCVDITHSGSFSLEVAARRASLKVFIFLFTVCDEVPELTRAVREIYRLHCPADKRVDLLLRELDRTFSPDAHEHLTEIGAWEDLTVQEGETFGEFVERALRIGGLYGSHTPDDFFKKLWHVLAVEHQKYASCGPARDYLREYSITPDATISDLLDAISSHHLGDTVLKPSSLPPKSRRAKLRAMQKLKRPS